MGSTSINLQIARFEQIQPPYWSSFPHSTIYSQENVYSLRTRNRISFRDRGFSDLYHDINVTYLYNQVFMHVGPLSAVNYSNYYTRIDTEMIDGAIAAHFTASNVDEYRDDRRTSVICVSLQPSPSICPVQVQRV